MDKENVINQENFDVLLNWLDRNREIAGQKYEKIRRRLIRIFLGRGCFEAEELADETINRVTRRLPQVAADYVGEPTHYFYAVANKIHLEWLRKQKKINELPLNETHNHAETESETEYECLETCLEALPNEQRGLIVEYYRDEKSAKIENRRQIAEKLGINVSTLQVKAFRIRSRLKECLQKCLAEKGWS
ncbi:MAG TPA: RNA polymerase sigma factor [Pyrinomonadaceae bacterium]|jgi:RNA polymerase sigma factor (sigma-70 family)